MKKQLCKLATEMQALLLHHAQGEGGLISAPRMAMDAWTALLAWHQAGEICIRLSDEQESALLANPLPPDLALTSAPARHGEAIALQMPERSVYIVVARIPAGEPIPVYREFEFEFRQPLLVYCSPGPPWSAGFVNLLDQPTPSAMDLRPGTILRARGGAEPLSSAEVTEEDYLLSVALTAFYK